MTGDPTLPLSPNEVCRLQAEQNLPTAKALIEKIDAAMLEGFDGSRFIRGDIPRLREGIALERAVFLAYRAKGWDVQRVSDQRDGDSWEFTPLP